jgi:MYXO-CTERM domain-containing protein
MYHLMSADGVHNWINTGITVAPSCGQDPMQGCTDTETNFIRYTDGTVNHWYNMERPNVVLENGHVAYFTFAVSDVNKNGQPPPPTASKVIVVPFDGVSFDCDNGGEDAGCPPDGGVVEDGGGGEAGGGEGRSSGSTDGGAGADATVSSSSGAGSSSGASSGSGTTSGTSGGGYPEDAGATTSGGNSSGCSCMVTGASGSSPARMLLGVVFGAVVLALRRRNLIGTRQS